MKKQTQKRAKLKRQTKKQTKINLPIVIDNLLDYHDIQYISKIVKQIIPLVKCNDIGLTLKGYAVIFYLRKDDKYIKLMDEYLSLII